MATLLRQLRRAEAWEREAMEQFTLAGDHIEILEAERQRLKDEVFSLNLKLGAANDVVTHERLRRVSAQRGLVAYMREAGLGDRIGYDPDEDPMVQQEIAEGKIPKPGLTQVMREVVKETIAARTVA